MSRTEQNKQGSKSQDSELEGELYQKRAKIYPREVHGIFARMRNLSMLILLGLYYGVPWLSWNGQQAILFDLPERKFHILGMVFWPQDFFLLTLLLIIAAYSLFFFTALAGRLWCGYACPQTVWTEIFLWMERRIEGNRQQQQKLDKQPMNARKLRIKTTKHLAWLIFSMWTGFTFVGYFTPIQELSVSVVNFDLGPWETFWIIFYGFATYGNAGWMREQVCIYMCPYARFQSAMFDKDTLLVAYDEKRGDPRGARKRGVDPASVAKGDCIDCTLCVQVCPTGIDIRDGLQYQCIGCAACIDVCDEVMDKMGYERGLVRYTTEHAVTGAETHIFRPRVIVYATILLILVVGMIAAVLARNEIGLDIIRDRNALYLETSGGMIENVYTLKIINKTEAPVTYLLSISGLDGARFSEPVEPIKVSSGDVLNYPVRVLIDPVNLSRPSSEILFTVQSQDEPDKSLTQPGRFLGPVGR